MDRFGPLLALLHWFCDPLVALCEFLFGDGKPELDQERIEYLAGDAPLQVAELAQQGRKGEAIRAYRKITRSDQREAVAVVEWLVSSGQNPQPPKP